MREGWAARLGRWLPSETARDLYRPSFEDLRSDELRRRSAAGGASAVLHDARYVLAVCVLYFECLRLAAFERVAAFLTRAHPAVRPPRKEYTVMFLRDVRHALRLFRREPGFAAAAVLTLALGIGANTALFAVVEAVLLRPLPYPEADALTILKHRDVRTGITKEFIAIGDYVDLHVRQRALEALAGFGGVQSTLMGAGDPVRVEGFSATPEIFAVLRLQLAQGRAFGPDDVREGAPPVVIVSHRLWQTQLGSDPDVLRRSIQLGATKRMVIGVLPAGFRFPPGQPADILLPQRVPAAPPAERKAGWIFAVGRLGAGATIDAATEELAALSQGMERDYPQQNQGSLYYAVSLRDSMVGDTKRALLLLLAAVGFVLLIACANVGNLLLARSIARQQELSMRLALGAARGRLVWQMLTEGLVLAVTGGLAGVAVAWWAAPALAAMVPQAAPIPGLDEVTINGGVLAFSLGASLVAALVFSGVASFGLARDGARGALVTERRITMSAGARRAASALVAAEIALAVVLLIAAGLTLRSFANLIAVDPGFSARGVVTMQIGLPPGRYADAAARRALYDRAFAAVDALPSVDTIGAAVVTPLTGNNWTVAFQRADQPLPSGQRPPDVGWQAASGGYFRALQIPLRAGRLFDARDTPQSPNVVIVSEALATRFYPGENAVGQRVRVGDGDAEIVGVVGDIRRAALSDAPRADMYFPFERQPAPSITLFVRASGDPLHVVPAVRTTLRAIEPGAVLYETRTLDDIAAESAAVARLAMRLLGGFAIVALALAAIGIYGVMSYNVRRRARELGTRVALGATRADIVRLVMRQAGLIALAGLAGGVAVGVAAARALSAILFGVPPWDPLALSAAATLLTLTALGASYLPARRAARVDPACTLAAE